MKLHADDGELAVAHAHDLTFLRPGRYDELLGEVVTVRCERVVASGLERIRQALEKLLPIVLDPGCLAVHQ